MKRTHAELFWNNVYVRQGKSQKTIFVFTMIAGVIESIIGWIMILK